jgi:predicted ArsR family transcriptional regulator
VREEGEVRRGRRPLGPRLVEGLEGEVEAKRRLQVILETVSGDRSVEQACDELGIEKAGFHKLRQRLLEAGLRSLEPKAAGRPSSKAAEPDPRIAALEAELRETRLELMAAQVREEIAVAMPGLLKPRAQGVKKTTWEG